MRATRYSAIDNTRIATPPVTYRYDKKLHSLFWPRLGVFTMLVMGLMFMSNYFSGSGQARTSNTDTKAATAQQVKKPEPTIALSALDIPINEIIAANPRLQISVSCINLKDGKSVHYGVEEAYIAASTAKLMTAIFFLEQVENKKFSLTTPVAGAPAQTQLKKLIEESDNTAWYSFNDMLGRDNLQTFANQNGLQKYDAHTNTITSNDIAIILQKLYTGKLLDKDHTKLLLSYMQNASEAEYIPAAVPENIKVYHKAGYLKDRVHDTAIIDDGKFPYVLVIFSKSRGDYDFTEGSEILQSITKATLEVFGKPVID